MAMMDQIIDTADRKFDDVKKLQETTDPIVMYGAGSYARDVTSFLDSHNVTIDEYCIDESYLSPEQQAFDGTPLSSIESAYQKHAHFNVVIGFNDYVKARATLGRLSDNADVYFIDAPNQYGFFDHQYIQDNVESFEETFGWLADEKSKEIFTAFINAKISGDPSGLYKLTDFNQYFGEPTKLSDREYFVDCGGFDGDTVFSFVKNVNSTYGHIYTFEPDVANYEKLVTAVKSKGLQNIDTINAGCWSSATTLRFSSNANMAVIVSGEADADFSVPVTTIDETVGDDPITFIKMDIEGAEYEALQGAARTITKNLPTLAICAYHKPDDLIVLPQYIKQLSSDYTLYLRHHQYMSWEMVLYAIPKAKTEAGAL